MIKRRCYRKCGDKGKLQGRKDHAKIVKEVRSFLEKHQATEQG